MNTPVFCSKHCGKAGPLGDCLWTGFIRILLFGLNQIPILRSQVSGKKSHIQSYGVPWVHHFVTFYLDTFRTTLPTLSIFIHPFLDGTKITTENSWKSRPRFSEEFVVARSRNLPTNQGPPEASGDHG